MADIGCGAADIEHGEVDNAPKVLHVVGIAKHLDSCHVGLKEQTNLEGGNADNQQVQPQVHDTEGCHVGLVANPRQT